MKKGFTIIEVTLVIAIAGLIFAMVFIALPALQRSSRDTTRRDDMAKFITNVKKYQTNNRGALPGNSAPGSVEKYEGGGSIPDTSWQGFYNKYLGENFIDPIGETYKLNIVSCDETISGNNCKDEAQYTGQSTMNYTMLVVLQATCSGEKSVATSNPRNLAVLYRLEGSGVACYNT